MKLPGPIATTWLKANKTFKVTCKPSMTDGLLKTEHRYQRKIPFVPIPSCLPPSLQPPAMAWQFSQRTSLVLPLVNSFIHLPPPPASVWKRQVCSRKRFYKKTKKTQKNPPNTSHGEKRDPKMCFREHSRDI